MSIEQKSQTVERKGEKNGFWLWDDLNANERDICYRLVHGGGMLGWNKKSLNAAHLKTVNLENLTGKEILRKVSLFQLAQELVNDEFSCWKKEEFDEMGGFMALTNEKDRDFFRDFDQATEMVNKGENADYLEERYQIARKDLYDFVSLF
ncbi:MAG: hypothetical protein NT052_00860 [Candidatus Shapirobacteria bacterium]|nr:hypothetical protein [Candidatus Shapirobacteria bacterium]